MRSTGYPVDQLFLLLPAIYVAAAEQSPIIRLSADARVADRDSETSMLLQGALGLTLLEVVQAALLDLATSAAPTW